MAEIAGRIRWGLAEAAAWFQMFLYDIWCWWFPSKTVYGVYRIEDGRVKARQLDMTTGAALKGGSHHFD